MYLLCGCSRCVKHRVDCLYSGRIEQVESLFYYVTGESYLTYAHREFKPLFLEDVLANMTAAQQAKAKQICGDNKECLFDFAVTGEYQTMTLSTHECSFMSKLYS